MAVLFLRRNESINCKTADGVSGSLSLVCALSPRVFTLTPPANTFQEHRTLFDVQMYACVTNPI